MDPLHPLSEILPILKVPSPLNVFPMMEQRKSWWIEIFI